MASKNTDLAIAVEPSSIEAAPSTQGLRPRTFDELMRLAEMVARSNLCPKGYQGKTGDVLIAMQMGSELGLAPLQSLQNVAVINGRPAVYGDALLAIVSASRVCAGVDEAYDAETMTATCTARRHGRSDVTSSFSQAQAKQAGLWGKAGPWTQYPERMLQMRARGFALRDQFADLLKGVQPAEVAVDTPEDPLKQSIEDAPSIPRRLVTPAARHKDGTVAHAYAARPGTEQASWEMRHASTDDEVDAGRTAMLPRQTDELDDAVLNKEAEIAKHKLRLRRANETMATIFDQMSMALNKEELDKIAMRAAETEGLSRAQRDDANAEFRYRLSIIRNEETTVK